MKKLAMLAALMTAVAVLGGCSAGGTQGNKTTGGGTPTPAPAPAPTAADLVVSVDKSTIQDNGSDSATITVTAVDANRNVVGSVPVTIVPDSNSGAILTAGSTTTSTAGTVAGTLTIGSDHSDRSISVLVTSGSITKNLTVVVTGATLTANAASGSVGSSASVVYHLADSAGKALGVQPITVSGDSGLTTVNDSTDANGNYTYNYTVPNTGSVSITAKAAGVSTTSTVTIATSSTPAASGTPVSESIAANPSSINVNTAGSTTNQVDVRALFLASGNLPVSNIRVRFDLDGDVNGIGGTLSSGSNYVYTDANGVARTSYIAGTRGSGNNAVTIRACWATTDFAAGSCPNATPVTTQITVVDSGVSISIFNNGKIIVDDTHLVYTIPFAVQVVDSVGNPQVGVTVSGAAYIPRYYRGYWVTDSQSHAYGAAIVGASGSLVPPQVCGNEDVNGNNILETYSNGDTEDANGSGKLEPYAADIAIVLTSAGSNVTDAFGKAYFTLQYGENVASWDDYTLTFSAIVQGTEGKNSISGTLPVPASVVAAGASGSSSPPFAVSPYNFTPNTNEAPIVVPTVTATDPVSGKSASLCTKQLL